MPRLTALATILLYLLAFAQRDDTAAPTRPPALAAPPAVMAASWSRTNGPAPRYEQRFVVRVPAGTMCHAASLAVLSGGRIACTWYQGSHEAARDVRIRFATYDEPAGAWTQPAILLDRQTAGRELGRYVHSLGNTILVPGGDGRLWLFYSSLAGPGWSTSSINWRVSRDDGQSWTPGGTLLLAPLFNAAVNVRHRAVALADASFLLPIYSEWAGGFPLIVRLVPGQARLRYAVWRMTGARFAIQPVLLAGEPGSLTAFLRNSAPPGRNHVLVARSTDSGRTWSEPAETPLPNPNSAIDVIVRDDGSWLAAVNNSFSGRHDLTLVLSNDHGTTWHTLVALEQGATKEYSYPSIVRGPGGAYHLTYTYERRAIKHVIFNDAWLESLR